MGDPQFVHNNLRRERNSDKAAQIPHDLDPAPLTQLIWDENLKVYVILKRIIKDNMDKGKNQKMKNIYTLLKNRFFWGVMDMEQNANNLERSS